jgi:hypothetical protein
MVDVGIWNSQPVRSFGRAGGPPPLALLPEFSDISRMSNRDLVIELVGKLPGDTPLEEIARQIDLLAGIRTARKQAGRREGIPAEDGRPLVEKWASQSF